MVELALIRSLLDKDFYGDHKGTRCPDELFSKDIRKIKKTVDFAMQNYGKDSITVRELESLFFAHNSTLTTSSKQVFKELFSKLEREQAMDKEIAKDVLSKLFQQFVGEKIANIGFDYVNGEGATLEPLRKIISDHQDNFLPNFKIDWDDISFDNILEQANQKSKWKFNIPSLAKRLQGISGGQLIIVGARPNTGKTSFHASIIASRGGFIDQGAKCRVLCNEEPYYRVASRYLCNRAELSLAEIGSGRANHALAMERYNRIRNNVKIKDVTGKKMDWVENMIKVERPDIVVLDMGDKFANRTGERMDLYLKEAAIHARNIAKEYDCAIIWMSQLSAEAEGKVNVDQSMLEGSKTGKAAEADLMLLLSKNPSVEGQEENDTQRHIIIAKNKINGWHGKIHVELDVERGRYTA